MPASPGQYRKEREYTPRGDLLFHASVGPSGAMTISGSQAAFVPVRRKGWHAGLMDGGWGLAVRALYRPARPGGRGRPLPGRSRHLDVPHRPRRRCPPGVLVVSADAGRLVYCGGLGVFGSDDGCGLGLPGSGGVLLGLFRACVGIGDLAGGPGRGWC